MLIYISVSHYHESNREQRRSDASTLINYLHHQWIIGRVSLFRRLLSNDDRWGAIPRATGWARGYYRLLGAVIDLSNAIYSRGNKSREKKLEVVRQMHLDDGNWENSHLPVERFNQQAHPTWNELRRESFFLHLPWPASPHSCVCWRQWRRRRIAGKWQTRQEEKW